MIEPINDLSRERLIELVLYDPIDGRFVWRYSIQGHIKQGEPAGNLDARGYWNIGIDGRLYAASRLAWLYVYGRWPKEEIDHANMNRSDNRINNLREASRSDNLHNGKVRPQNIAGKKGIRQLPSGRWIAQIQRNKIHHYLGSFDTADDAQRSYREAAQKFYGEFARWM